MNSTNNLSKDSKIFTSKGKFIGFAVTSLAFGLLATSPAQASTFTRGSLPIGVSEVGGIVLDLTGSNGTRVVTQAAASSLFQGQPSTTPITIGTQSGFTPSVISVLGGGITQASVRISLFDGDTAAGDFDFNNNTLFLNNVNFGNFSSVNAENTTSAGVSTSLGFSSGGFRNNTLDTGFFTSNDAPTLSSLFTSLNSGSVVFGLRDVDPGDNFYDFTQGIDSSLINIGTGPVITPGATAVPEPFTIVGTLMGAATAFRMRKRLKVTNKL